MMSKDPPVDFKKRFDIVGCLIESNDKFLLLRRQPQKANGNKWGLPAGKRDDGEELKKALAREVQEETGIDLARSSVDLFRSWYVRDKDFDIEWHMFSVKLPNIPAVVLNSHEHSESKWVTKDEALQMDLIHDLAESLQLFYENFN